MLSCELDCYLESSSVVLLAEVLSCELECYLESSSVVL